VGLTPFLKLANALGMEWVVLADGDASGQTYAQQAAQFLNGKDAATHIKKLPADNIEVYLCQTGHGHLYEANVSQQKATSITAAKGTDDYWRQVVKAQPNKSKPRMAFEVAQAIRQAGAAAVPPMLKEAIDSAVELARAS
jgi:putative ATP-dependent endonuclease of OLD family